jgi:hypothetical protein
MPNTELRKRATMIGEYEALLQSALEDQAQHYEERLCDLSRLDGRQVDAGMTKEELGPEKHQERCCQIRAEIDRVSRGLLAGARSWVSSSLTDFAWAAGFSGHAQEIKGRFQQRARRNMQVEELELQIADLTANFRMRDQFSGELSNAQIYGTTGNEAKPNKKGGKKSDVSSESEVLNIGVGTGVLHSSDDEVWGRWSFQMQGKIGPVPSTLHPPGGVLHGPPGLVRQNPSAWTWSTLLYHSSKGRYVCKQWYRRA